MSSRIEQLSSNPTLTSFIKGAGEQAVSKVASFISPTVAVARAVGKYKVWNDKSRLVIPDTRRAVGGKAARITFETSDGNYNCEPHALDASVDFVEKDETEVVENLIKEGASIAAQLGAMAHEQTVSNQALADATAGNAIDTTSSSTKIIDILNAHLLDVIKGAKGWGAGMELRLLIGATALQKICGHSDITGRYKSQSKAGGYYSPTLTDIAGMLMLPVNAQVSLMVADANKNLDAASVDFLLGDKVLVFASVPSPTRYDTSFMKPFRTMGGFMVPRYYQSEDKRQDLAGFDWSEDVATTNASASRLCAVS